jgi:hypothetical protein
LRRPVQSFSVDCDPSIFLKFEKEFCDETRPTSYIVREGKFRQGFSIFLKLSLSFHSWIVGPAMPGLDGAPQPTRTTSPRRYKDLKRKPVRLA